MTIPQEIAQLKSELQAVVGLNEQGEIILKILHKYAKFNIKDGQLYIERLEVLANELNNDEYSAWAYYYRGKIHNFSGSYDAALAEFEKAHSLFTLLNHQTGIATLSITVGTVYFYQGNYPGALSNYMSALKLNQQTGHKPGIASMYNNIGNVYLRQGDYAQSLSNHLTALKIREETGDKPAIADSYNNIGTIYQMRANYNDALSNYLTAQKIREEVGNRPAIIPSYLNVGTIYLKQGNYDEALSNFSAALKISKETGDKLHIALLHHNIGNAYYEQGNYTTALPDLLTGFKISEQIGYKEGMAEAGVAIGNCYVALKEFARASGFLNNALNIAKEINAKASVRNSLKACYELKKAVGDSTEALAYHEEFVLVENELRNEASAREIAAMQFGYQIEKKEQEVLFERQKKEALQTAYHLLETEKQRSEALLLNILPAQVADELKMTGGAEAKLFENVTVLFSDFKDFTKHSERMSPQDLVNELHACFKGFDEIISKYNIEKIKTVGDAYLAVSGLPAANPNHAADLVNAALAIRDFMLHRKSKIPQSQIEPFEVRIGIHSGRVVAGIVGVKKFAYDIWGDTVNTAARMEQNGEAGKVNVSEATYGLLKDKFKCEYRGELEAKNKGKLKMYFVERSIHAI